MYQHECWSPACNSKPLHLILCVFELVRVTFIAIIIVGVVYYMCVDICVLLYVTVVWIVKGLYVYLINAISEISYVSFLMK